MTKERIDKAIEVIRYAISNNISVKEASVKCGYSDTYVKNVKRTIKEAYDSNVLDDSEFDRFMSVYESYELSKSHSSNTIDYTKDVIEGEKLKVDQNDDLIDVEWNGKNGDNNTFGYPNGHIKTLNQLLEKTEVDLNIWKVESHVVNKWDVTSWKNGFPQTWENFQVKARLVKDKKTFDGTQVADVFKELVKSYQAPVVDAKVIDYYKKNNVVENNLLEISLFDLHIGKLGWAGEVGENYDTKIAVNRFHDAIDNLLKRAKGFDFSKILFPIGNDFFNSDNLHNTTTNGTPQDEDLRWQKTFKMGCQLIIDGINKLKATGVQIDVPVIPGNHDFERSYYLGTVMEAWFKDDPQVNIDNGANPRKYYEFGEVLIGLTHGKEEKENSLPMLMATEQKEAWGRTTYHEWHLGHFHKKRNVKFSVFDKGQILNEELGVVVRYLSSLSGTEEWHFKKGYVGSQKAGEAFVWNDKTGMIGHLNFNFTDYDREE